MKTENLPKLNIINEDGTSIEDFPKNPLIDKWLKLKKNFCIQLEESGFANYRCLECTKCPDSSDFEIPEEDIEEYEKYLTECKEYNRIHNPELFKKMVLAKVKKQ